MLIASPTSMRSSILANLRRFLRNDTGTATVEFVLWLPLVLLIFGTIVDFSLVLSGEAQALRVVQDANRGLSVGHFQTIAAAKSYILTQVASLSSRATIDMTVVNGVIMSRLTLPAADLMATGMYSGLINLKVTVVAQFLSEA